MGLGKWLHALFFGCLTDKIEDIEQRLSGLENYVSALYRKQEKRKYEKTGKYKGRFVRVGGVGINLKREPKKRKMSYYQRKKLSKALLKYHASVPEHVKRERIAKMLISRKKRYEK